MITELIRFGFWVKYVSPSMSISKKMSKKLSAVPWSANGGRSRIPSVAFSRSSIRPPEGLLGLRRTSTGPSELDPWRFKSTISVRTSSRPFPLSSSACPSPVSKYTCTVVGPLSWTISDKPSGPTNSTSPIELSNWSTST